MKILYVGMKYDYGDPKRGLSFERLNFYDALLMMDGGVNEVVEFAFDERLKAVGKESMNRELVEAVKLNKPDLCFFFLFADEIYPETIRKIGKLNTVTFNWFADDHWRFANFSKHYAPLFNWVSTTDSFAPEKYFKIGYHNIIKTQWACNPHLYRPMSIEKYRHDTSFVGQPHGTRRSVVRVLGRAGIRVDCYGSGWESGRIDHEKMIEVFCTSKVNLNFTKSSAGIDLKSFIKIFTYRKDAKIKVAPPRSWRENVESFIGKQREQIKGRNFEIPGCGAFLLTGQADNLEDYYIPDKEVVLFDSVDDMIDKVRYYLDNEEKRKEVASAGYERTIREHTYEIRFRELFKTMGFSV